MSGVRFDIWRYDSAGFLDRIDEGIKANSPQAAVRRSSRARNGRLYVAMPTRLTAKPLDANGVFYRGGSV